jgi:DNA polymerase-3 subunit epsilon
MTGGRWYEGPLLSFDTETTGVDVENDRIVSATVIEIYPQTIYPHPSPNATSWLVNPGIEIPAEASAVHGITTERARTEGRNPAEAVAEIGDQIRGAFELGVPVVAYNAAFDLTILDRELRRHGLKPLDVEGAYVIDPLVLDKAFDKYRKGKRTLTRACEVYGLVLEDAHTSDADALAAARVAWKIAQKFAPVRVATLDELQVSQAKWYAEQQAGLADYFRRKARGIMAGLAEIDAEERDAAQTEADGLLASAESMTGEWPLRPVPAVAGQVAS